VRLSDIIRGLRGIFERKRKNPVLLSTDSNLESKLKPLKVANKNTPIQISEDTVDVKGSLKVNGVDVSTEPDDDTDTGATELNELSDVTYSSGDLTIDSLDKIIADDFVVDSGAGITLDSHSGNFIAKKAGTEFSVANSAYAGMILGYRMIGEDASRVTYTLTTSFVVPDDDMGIRFIAPPSGAVEIMIQIKVDAQANNTTFIGLSTANATSGYSTAGATYEQAINLIDETDNATIQHYWAVTGLTAGDTYNYWVGFKKQFSGVGNGYLNWGGGSGEHCDFIMKATALPTAVSDFAEYD